MSIFLGKEVNPNELDIIERLEDEELYIDAIDDAIREIQILRGRVAELEAAQQPLAPDAATPPHVCDFSNSLHCPVCGVAVF